MDAGFSALDADDASSDNDALEASDAGHDAPHADAQTTADASDASFGAESGTLPDASDASSRATLYGCGTPPLAMPDGGPSIPLINLGHSEQISALFESGNRVLSSDGYVWILWDTLTGKQVATGSLKEPLALVGPLFILQGTDLELRAASDGSLIGTIQGSTIPLDGYSQVGIAPDASYVWARSGGGIVAWSPTGVQLFNRVGDYGASPVFAAPSELRIAVGPAGSSVIEYIEVPSGTESVSEPFSGTFAAWFTDGSAFLTAVGPTVRVYGENVNQLEIVALPSNPSCATTTPCGLGGDGNYFWTYVAGYDFTLYAVGGGSTPVAQDIITGAIFPVPGMIGFLEEDSNIVDIIQLGATVTRTSVPVISVYNTLFAADDGGRWSVGSQYGVVSYVGTTNDSSATGPLGCGQATVVAGSASGTSAIGTASGSVLIFDTASRTLISEISNLFSTHIALSGDGTILAATDDSFSTAYLPHGDLYIYSLPDASLINHFAAADFDLARGGARIGFPTGNGGEVSNLSGTMVESLDGTTGYVPSPRLSPSGTYIAMSNLVQSPSSTTLLFDGTTLVNAVPGYAVGWIDDNDLLVQTYTMGNDFINPYSQTTIYSNAGTVVASPTMMPELPDFDVISPSRIFSNYTIIDVTTGTYVGSVATGGCYPEAALAGQLVVCSSRYGVFLWPL